MVCGKHAIVLILCLCASGCIGLWPHVEKRHGKSSSMVEFLYPGGAILPEYDERVPYLELPLTVGLAFLPGDYYPELSEVRKQDALAQVRGAFADREYIRDIVVIPSNYISVAKGASGVAQLGRTYGVDAVALVGYDQLAVSDERDSAILYWTIVGAYLVKGTHHEVQTFVDTAVVDVRTAKLLMRAPGTSYETGNVTLSDSRRDLAGRQLAGFDSAVDSMIANLETELSEFEERVRAGGDDAVKVAWRAGSGGGPTGPVVLILLVVALLSRHYRRAGNQVSCALGHADTYEKNRRKTHSSRDDCA